MEEELIKKKRRNKKIIVASLIIVVSIITAFLFIIDKSEMKQITIPKIVKEGFMDYKKYNVSIIYNTTNNSATVWDLDKGEPMAVFTLLTPLNVVVPRGYQKVAEIEIYSMEKLKILLKNNDIYDKNDGFSITNDTIDLKIRNISQVEVDDYSLVCNEVTNESGTFDNCTYIVNGSHFEDRITWENLTKKDFEKDERIIIGLFTHVGKGDNKEWIPTFELDDDTNITIEEWATWTEDISVGLVSYWNMNSTDFFDLMGINNGTNNGASIVTGVIENAGDFELSEGDYVNVGNSLTLNPNDMTISAWVKIESTPDYIMIMGRWQNSGSTQDCYVFRITANGYAEALLRHQASLRVLTDNQNLEDGKWHFIVLTTNSTSSHLYVDSVRVVDGAGGDMEESPDYDTMISALIDTGIKNFDGVLDEIGFWNRSLTQEEITYLNTSYNDGCGFMDDCGEETPANDTCTYSSGNWEVNCDDGCNITSNVNVDSGSGIILSGTGYFNIMANVSTDYLIKPTTCDLINKANDGNWLMIKA